MPIAVRTIVRWLILSACLPAASALARPLTLDLGLPALACPLLLGQDYPPPPVVLPPGPAQAPGPNLPVAAGEAPDTVRLRDGRELHGKILYQVQGGLLFHDAESRSSFVLPFGDIMDLRQPSAGPPGRLLQDERHFLLETQLRDLEARADALTVWPPVEELLFGLVGVAGGVILYVIGGPGSLLWAALVGVPGLITLLIGGFDLASVLRREADLEGQIGQLRRQLGEAGAMAEPPSMPVALRF